MKIYQATLEQLDSIADLFDQYRQFYKQAPDYDGCRLYIEQRLQNNESIIFVAENEAGEIVGFTQLYPAFCSVARAPYFQLYDLFVLPSVRRQGVGRLLMDRAAAYAKGMGVCRLQLETAVDNHEAQALYEAIGYKRDQDFFTYQLAL